MGNLGGVALFLLGLGVPIAAPHADPLIGFAFIALGLILATIALTLFFSGRGAAEDKSPHIHLHFGDLVGEAIKTLAPQVPTGRKRRRGGSGMAKERAKPEIAADRPPPFLSPFMDCVEGAGCAPEGDYPGTRWLLYRNGEVVGDIRVPWTNHPYPSGDRGPKL